jgi:hypothetical protein
MFPISNFMQSYSGVIELFHRYRRTMNALNERHHNVANALNNERK